MKKLFILFLAASFLFGGVIFAQDLGVGNLGKVVNKVPGLKTTGLEARVGGIIASVLGMLGTVFLVLTIYAGVLWMTASGDEGKIEKAKEILKAAIIGLAIVLSAYTITYFVGNRLGGQGSSTGLVECKIGEKTLMVSQKECNELKAAGLPPSS